MGMEWTVMAFIVQQIRTMAKFGQKDSVIRHPYITDILRYT